MILLRRAKETDLAGICKLPSYAGVGITTLPDDPEFLARRLKHACESFEKNTQIPGDEYYWFVLESIEANQAPEIIGVSAIEATSGAHAPFYSYALTKSSHQSESLSIKNDYYFLTLSNENQGKSELCTLFLKPAFRHHGNGLLLSRGRFLFMAAHPTRFTSSMIAELRGIIDETGISPFWEHVGKHFFHMPFTLADRLTMTSNKQFIAELLPQIPIYMNLLPPEAQAVIGKPNAAGIAAMNILIREGFQWNNTVDIFDAGPTVEASISQIKTIQDCKLIPVKSIVKNLAPKATPHILGNHSFDFRATIAPVLIDESDPSLTIDQQTADLLAVQVNQSIQIVPLVQPRNT